MTMIMMIYGDSNDVDVLMCVSNDHGYAGDNVNDHYSCDNTFGY